jgi:hypothetical protein
MVVELEVGYCDTRAEDLGWSLDLEPLPALATRELAGAGFLVELRLLGASHQVVVRGPDPGGAPLCLETLACIPDRTHPVPAETALPLGSWQYAFVSHHSRHGLAEFGRLLAGIEWDSRSGILGRYPGAPGAVTAIALREDGSTLHWSTWHTYPQQGVIVTTHSTLSAIDEPVAGAAIPLTIE